MPRIKLEINTESKLDAALSYVPEVKVLYDQMYDFLWKEEELPKELKEKIRLYLANVNGCDTCLSLSYVGDAGLNEELTERFSNKSFEGFEKDLFALIDRYRGNPREVSDQDVAWLSGYFSEAQIIKLMALIHLFDGFHKLIVSLDLYDFCSLKGRS